MLLPTWPLARPGHWNKLNAGACPARPRVWELGELEELGELGVGCGGEVVVHVVYVALASAPHWVQAKG